MQDQLKQLLEANGSQPIDQIMHHVISGEEQSYYEQGKTLGRDADFITAPEISQLYSDMIAVWVQLCAQQFSGKSIVLVELGPGRGFLMDVILHFCLRQQKLDIKEVALVERSRTLRKIQQEKLAKYNCRIEWYDDFADIAQHECPTIIVSNEFFDALPIKQFIKSDSGWDEIHIMSQNNQFIYQYEAGEFKPENLDMSNINDGAIYELMHDGRQVMHEISKRIKQHGGSALIVDYGYAISQRANDNLVSSLQAISKHKYVDVLTTLGSADLSAHVDFLQLQSEIDKDLYILGAIEQRQLLQMLGVDVRLQQLLKNTDNMNIYHVLLRQYQRLMSASQMGQLFKGLMIASFDLKQIFITSN